MIVSDSEQLEKNKDMADDENVRDVEQEEEVDYKAPPEKSIDEMLQSDKDDEALQKYKAALLGDSVAGSGAVVVDESDPRKVIVKKLSLLVEGREDATIDLTQGLATIKAKTFVNILKISGQNNSNSDPSCTL